MPIGDSSPKSQVQVLSGWAGIMIYLVNRSGKIVGCSGTIINSRKGMSIPTWTTNVLEIVPLLVMALTTTGYFLRLAKVCETVASEP